MLTTHLNDGGKLPNAAPSAEPTPYLGAPYGVYKTSDGYLALAMGSVVRLGELLSCPELLAYGDSKSLFAQRDNIKRILAGLLVTDTTDHWLSLLEPADIWCADVFTWSRLLNHEGFPGSRLCPDRHSWQWHQSAHHPLPHPHRRPTSEKPEGRAPCR